MRIVGGKKIDQVYQNPEFLVEILKMLYQNANQDVATVTKFSKMNSFKDTSQFLDVSMNRSKGQKQSDGDESDDINPKLSLTDTPVSGVKILRPGSKLKVGRHLSSSPLVRREGALDFSSIPVESQTQEKIRGESLFMSGEQNREEKGLFGNSLARHKTSLSPRVTFRSDERDGPVFQSRRSGKRSERSKSSSRKTRSFHKSKELIRKESMQKIKQISSRGKTNDSGSKRLKSYDFNQKSLFFPSSSRDSSKRKGYINSLSQRDLHSHSKLSQSSKLAKRRNNLKMSRSQDFFRETDIQQKCLIDLAIEPISENKIKRLHGWLKDLSYLKYYCLEDGLPEECRNGSFFFKLINYLERQPVLKGANTSNPTAIKVNFNKVFDKLGKFEKFNPRYLNSEYYLISGNKDVFWGLVDDIRLVYGNKIGNRLSARDVENTQRQLQGSVERESEGESRSRLSYSISQGPSRTPSAKRTKFHDQSCLTQIQRPEGSVGSKRALKSVLRRPYSSKSKSPSRHSFEQAPSATNYSTISTANLMRSKPKKAGPISVHRSSCNVRYVDLDNTTNGKLKKEKIDVMNLASLEADCSDWFSKLGFRVSRKKTLFDNNLRNGYLLCCVASYVFNRPLKRICKEPKTVVECKNNIESALNLIRGFKTTIPYELLWQTDEIMKGNPQIIWQLFSALKFLHQSNCTSGKMNFNQGANLSSVNMRTLPYSEDQIDQLGTSLMGWLISLGVFNRNLQLPSEIEDVLESVSEGVIISKIIFKLTGKVLRGLHLKPISKPNFTHNVRKCLDFLKEQPRMSRKFLWKVEPVVDCDKLSILGLLEDLHRFGDGLPRRRDPHYFVDGPYIRQFDLSRLKLQDANTSSPLTQPQTQQPPSFLPAAKNPGLGPLVSSSSLEQERGGLNPFRIGGLEDDSQDILDVVKQKPACDSDCDPQEEANLRGQQEYESLKLRHPEVFNPDLLTNPSQEVSTHIEGKETSSGLKNGQKLGFQFMSNDNVLEPSVGQTGHFGISSQDDNSFIDTGALPYDKIRKVVKLLLLLNMPKVVEKETWNSSVWTLFSDG